MCLQSFWDKAILVLSGLDHFALLPGVFTFQDFHWLEAQLHFNLPCCLFWGRVSCTRLPSNYFYSSGWPLNAWFFCLHPQMQRLKLCTVTLSHFISQFCYYLSNSSIPPTYANNSHCFFKFLICTGIIHYHLLLSYFQGLKNMLKACLMKYFCW